MLNLLLISDIPPYGTIKNKNGPYCKLKNAIFNYRATNKYMEKTNYMQNLFLGFNMMIMHAICVTSVLKRKRQLN